MDYASGAVCGDAYKVLAVEYIFFFCVCVLSDSPLSYVKHRVCPTFPRDSSLESTSREIWLKISYIVLGTRFPHQTRLFQLFLHLFLKSAASYSSISLAMFFFPLPTVMSLFCWYNHNCLKMGICSEKHTVDVFFLVYLSL